MASKFFYLLLLVATTYSSPDEKIIETTSTRAIEGYRLPTGAVEVSSYKVDLRLGTDIFDTNVFYGDAEVVFKNVYETNEIQIHANKITFDEVVLRVHDGNEIAFENTEFVIDDLTDILLLTTTASLAANTDYHLTFTNYSAVLRTDELNGFYKSSYVTSDGTTRYLGTTQFQPTHARKAFPCFDEPFYKAKFDISIRHPSEYSALGNTASTVIPDSTDPGYTITTFDTTPTMSTYLIAFIVSDFTCTSGDLVEQGIPHVVCSRPESWSTRALAVNVGPKLARTMGAYTGVPYSVSTITKIHEVAIPDFSAGAMENWGLVTYRETALLWDPEESSNRYKQRVETVVAHELSHFWFGNLVTCHWWSDTFLNEGFATYFEFFATNEIEPEWQMENQFVIEELQPVLISDAAQNSAPLSMDVSSPSQVSGRFSTVSYSKGGSIFRMVRYILGLENFKQGLNLYLETNKFKPVTPADLWAAFETVKPDNLPATIPELMQNWVELGGFPLITVTVDGRNVKLSQKRFLSNTTGTSDRTWYVPITYTTSSDSNKFENTTPSVWLRPSVSEITLTDALQSESDWIILNNGQTGYYRIEYPDEVWDKIGAALKKENFDGIPEINRAQLVDDLYNFARYGYRTFADLLKFYEFLENDTSYFPWYAAFTAFNSIINRIGDETITTAFSSYLTRLIKVVYDSVPFDDYRDDDQIYTHNKVLIVPWACRLGLQDCVDSALAAFADYKNNGVTPNKNLKSVVYCNGLRHSTDIENDWNFLWNVFLNTTLSTEQVTLLSVLGCTTDETVLKNYLKKSIDSNSGIRAQDALSVFSAVYSGNAEGVDVAFDFLIENFDGVANGYGTMNSISSIFNALATRFTRQDQAEKLEAFINSGTLGNHETAARNALATALTNLEVTGRFEEELKLYFDSIENNTSESISSGFATILTSFVLFYYQYLH